MSHVFTTSWTTRRPAGQHRTRARPRLEVLEGRTLPATVYWINPDGGDWAVPGNWSTGSLPGINDDAVIELPGNYTVSHSGGATIIRSLLSERAFTLSGGSLSVAATSTIRNAFTF